MKADDLRLGGQIWPPPPRMRYGNQKVGEGGVRKIEIFFVFEIIIKEKSKNFKTIE